MGQEERGGKAGTGRGKAQMASVQRRGVGIHWLKEQHQRSISGASASKRLEGHGPKTAPMCGSKPEMVGRGAA